MSTKTRARIEALNNIPENGKAEILNGKIVRIMPAGGMPGRASGSVSLSLHSYERERGGGYAFGDNVGFIVDLPNRQSFSPDAAWYTGQLEGMTFLSGALPFAVEVRSENNYGPTAERESAEKRRDYFAAGTLVVWDVDLLSDDVIRVYRVGMSQAGNSLFTADSCARNVKHSADNGVQIQGREREKRKRQSLFAGYANRREKHDQRPFSHTESADRDWHEPYKID